MAKVSVKINTLRQAGGTYMASVMVLQGEQRKKHFGIKDLSANGEPITEERQASLAGLVYAMQYAHHVQDNTEAELEWDFYIPIKAKNFDKLRQSHPRFMQKIKAWKAANMTVRQSTWL